MPSRTFACAATLFIGLILAYPAVVRAQSTSARMHVLFIGNSYTMYHRMPDTVAAMGRGLGYDLRVTIAARGGASFADHLRRRETLDAIDSRQWDVVVLQNFSLQPGLRPRDVERRSAPHARALAVRIRRTSPAARIVYYETWGRRDGVPRHHRYYPQVTTFVGHGEAVSEGYRIYRRHTGGAIAPVGTNWRRIVEDADRRRPFGALELWAEDGSHPGRIGSYLAAATILGTIINGPVVSSTEDAGLPPEVALYLREVVDGIAALAPRRSRGASDLPPPYPGAYAYRSDGAW